MRGKAHHPWKTYTIFIDFLTELYKSDFIQYNNLKLSCPKLHCVLKALSSGADNWFCGNISEVTSSTNYTYMFEFTNAPNIHTTYKNKGAPARNTITTYIPYSFCNGTSGLSDLELESKFIHEGFHAVYNGWIFDDVDGQLINYTAFEYKSDYWVCTVEDKYGPVISGNHHALFLTKKKKL